MHTFRMMRFVRCKSLYSVSERKGRMNKLQTIRREQNVQTCRRCINQLYHVELLPKDCKYGNPYPHPCPVCGEMQNIVTGFRLSGKIKLFRA